MQKHFLHIILLAIVAMMMFALPQHAQAQEKEAYVVKSDDGTTLTFYYDTQKATRTGTKWGINETQTEDGETYRAWAGTRTTKNTTITQAVIDPSFKDFRPKTTAHWFYSLEALTQITGIENLNTGEVTDMNYMFCSCATLTQLDVSKFDTQKVTDMHAMFSACYALPQLDLSNFDTRNVTNMSGMFWGCTALTQLDVSKFDTQNVTDMHGMFVGCKALTQVDVSKFDTRNVTNIHSMFRNCASLVRIDVSNFDMQNVITMSGIFLDCKSLTTIYCNEAWMSGGSSYMFKGCVQLKGAVSYDENKTGIEMANPETGYFTKTTNDNKEAYVVKSNDGTTLTFYYDTQKATRTGTKWGVNATQTDQSDAYSAYRAWTGTFKTPNTTVTQVVFDPSFKDFRPKTTDYWFYNLEALTQITGNENLNTEEVTHMRNMFAGCIALTQLDVSKFDTKNVTKMQRMFAGCIALTQLDVSKFDTKNVISMSSMFRDCAALTQLDLSKFDTKNVTDMGSMFRDCAALTQLNLSNFDTQNVTNMWYMFAGCKALTQLDLSNFDTKNVTYMSHMFEGCTSLISINNSKITRAKASGLANSGLQKAPTAFNVSNFNTANVTNMSYMFADCSSLTILDLTNFNTEKVTDMRSMFKGCSSLTTIYCNDAWTCSNTADMFKDCVKLKGATEYAAGNIDNTMVNPDTGYFTKKDATDIVQTGHTATVRAIYSVDGRRLKELQPGVNIVTMSDGTTRKVVKK